MMDVDDDFERLVDSLEEELRPFLDSLDPHSDFWQLVGAIEGEVRPIVEALERDRAGDLAGGRPDSPAGKNPGGEAAGHDGPNRSGAG